MKRIALVSCGQHKLNVAAPAKQLYTSARFKAARAYAESAADRWYIVSGKHGLLDPTDVIEPYDAPISRLTPYARSKWASLVADKLESKLEPGDLVVILASTEYSEPLCAEFKRRGVTVELPELASLPGLS